MTILRERITDEYLADRVDVVGDCWIWSLSTFGNGYGQLSMRVEGRKSLLAHRAVYRALVGPIADDDVLDHLCRVKACVNPDHLDPVTQAINLDRGVGSKVSDACRRGHPWSEQEPVMRSGRRTCRVCYNASRRRMYARRGELMR